MKKVVTIQVGADGVLNLTLPLGAMDAKKTVRVTLETVDEPAACTGPPLSFTAWDWDRLRARGRSFGKER